MILSCARRADKGRRRYQLLSLIEIQISRAQQILSSNQERPEIMAVVSVSDVWKDILGATPSRFDVTFASSASAGIANNQRAAVEDSCIIINSAISLKIRAYCKRESISIESFALGVLRRSLRSYSHESFAVGLYHEGNIVLIPFVGGEDGGRETLQAIQNRWENEILPYAATPYSEVKQLGYGCNVVLAINTSVDRKEANADLYVTWSDSGSGDGSIRVSFESGIGPWPGIEDRFHHIIDQILAGAPSSSYSSPDDLLPQERAQVLDWGTGAKDPIRKFCLHELIEEQARIRPNAIALMNNCGRDTMTYGELDAKAHRLAVELQKRGVKPNSFVGILMGGEKTSEVCVAVLGVLKSGAAYVPMDAVLFPAERIKFITEDTNMNVIVTVGEYLDVVLEGEFEMMLVEEVMGKMSNDELALERDVKPDDCAYMIYTSGTTGTPKGVVCHHLGPVNMIFYDTGVKVFNSCHSGDDIVGCSAPLIFDVFVYGYFGALGSGLTLSLDMKCLTKLHCTPSVADIFLLDKTNTIKSMAVGGEACIQGLESKGESFINTYGPTEASVWCTASARADTIGNPLPNTLCYVVHPDDGTLCPPGVSGELWVGGIGVSKGYHNRPERTAEKFIPNPFSASGRVY